MPKPCEKDEIEMRIYKWYNVPVEIDKFLIQYFFSPLGSKIETVVGPSLFYCPQHYSSIYG